ncbi:hypothetical protein JXQ70_00485 [bacterium]|nr:hypothetical protein [bacterium]
MWFKTFLVMYWCIVCFFPVFSAAREISPVEVRIENGAMQKGVDGLFGPDIAMVTPSNDKVKDSPDPINPSKADTAKIVDCIPEGGLRGPLSPPCCRGLTNIQYREYYEGYCVPALDQFICLNLNGDCNETYENSCNLPEDCGCNSNDECREGQVCFEGWCLDIGELDECDPLVPLCPENTICKSVNLYFPPDCACDEDFFCVPAQDTCGNGYCEQLKENCLNCYEDCASAWPYDEIAIVPEPKHIFTNCQQIIEVAPEGNWTIYADLGTEDEFAARELKDWLYQVSQGSLDVPIVDIPAARWPLGNKIVIGNPVMNTSVAAISNIDLDERLPADGFQRDQGYVIETLPEGGNWVINILADPADIQTVSGGTGAYYGMITMTWFFTENQFVLPVMIIEDWPDVEIRAYWGNDTDDVPQLDPIWLDDDPVTNGNWSVNAAGTWNYSSDDSGCNPEGAIGSGSFTLNGTEPKAILTMINPVPIGGHGLFKVKFDLKTKNMAAGTSDGLHLDWYDFETDTWTEVIYPTPYSFWTENGGQHNNEWLCTSNMMYLPAEAANYNGILLRFRLTSDQQGNDPEALLDNITLIPDEMSAFIDTITRYKYNMWPHAAGWNGYILDSSLKYKHLIALNKYRMDYTKERHFYPCVNLARDITDQNCPGVIEDADHNLREGWWAENIPFTIVSDVAVPCENPPSCTPDAFANLLPNPSFDQGSDPEPDNWDFIQATTNDSEWSRVAETPLIIDEFDTLETWDISGQAYIEVGTDSCPDALSNWQIRLSGGASITRTFDTTSYDQVTFSIDYNKASSLFSSENLVMQYRLGGTGEFVTYYTGSGPGDNNWRCSVGWYTIYNDLQPVELKLLNTATGSTDYIRVANLNLNGYNFEHDEFEQMGDWTIESGNAVTENVQDECVPTSPGSSNVRIDGGCQNCQQPGPFSSIISPIIDTTGYANLDLKVDYLLTGLETTEYLQAYYRVDGGVWLLLYEKNDSDNLWHCDNEVELTGLSTDLELKFTNTADELIENVRLDSLRLEDNGIIMYSADFTDLSGWTIENYAEVEQVTNISFANYTASNMRIDGNSQVTKRFDTSSLDIARFNVFYFNRFNLDNSECLYAGYKFDTDVTYQEWFINPVDCLGGGDNTWHAYASGLGGLLVLDPQGHDIDITFFNNADEANEAARIDHMVFRSIDTTVYELDSLAEWTVKGSVVVEEANPNDDCGGQDHGSKMRLNANTTGDAYISKIFYTVTHADEELLFDYFMSADFEPNEGLSVDCRIHNNGSWGNWSQLFDLSDHDEVWHCDQSHVFTEPSDMIEIRFTNYGVRDSMNDTTEFVLIDNLRIAGSNSQSLMLTIPEGLDPNEKSDILQPYIQQTGSNRILLTDTYRRNRVFQVSFWLKADYPINATGILEMTATFRKANGSQPFHSSYTRKIARPHGNNMVPPESGWGHYVAVFSTYAPEIASIDVELYAKGTGAGTVYYLDDVAVSDITGLLSNVITTSTTKITVCQYADPEQCFTEGVDYELVKSDDDYNYNDVNFGKKTVIHRIAGGSMAPDENLVVNYDFRALSGEFDARDLFNFAEKDFYPAWDCRIVQPTLTTLEPEYVLIFDISEFHRLTAGQSRDSRSRRLGGDDAVTPGYSGKYLNITNHLNSMARWLNQHKPVNYPYDKIKLIFWDDMLNPAHFGKGLGNPLSGEELDQVWWGNDLLDTDSIIPGSWFYGIGWGSPWNIREAATYYDFYGLKSFGVGGWNDVDQYLHNITQWSSQAQRHNLFGLIKYSNSDALDIYAEYAWNTLEQPDNTCNPDYTEYFDLFDNDCDSEIDEGYTTSSPPNYQAPYFEHNHCGGINKSCLYQNSFTTYTDEVSGYCVFDGCFPGFQDYNNDMPAPGQPIPDSPVRPDGCEAFDCVPYCEGSSESGSTCYDGLDNDGDGLIDWWDELDCPYL